MKEKATLEANGGRDQHMGICIYCANKNGEACLEKCIPEGRYRYLVPEPLPAWEAPPELPPFKEFVDMPAPLKLAYLYLVAHYQRLIVDG